MPLPAAVAGAWSVVQSLLVRIGVRAGAKAAAGAIPKGTGWLVTAGVSTGIAVYEPSILRKFNQLIATFAANQAGIKLDSSNPFSDASLCNAIYELTGAKLRTLKNVNSVKRDVERWGLTILEEKTGLRIRNVRNTAMLKQDIMKFASPYVSETTGIPFSDISDPDKVKSELLIYMKEKALALLADDIPRLQAAVESALQSAGSSAEQVAQSIMDKAGYDAVTGKSNLVVDAQTVALALLARALVKAGNERAIIDKGIIRQARRKQQRRDALRRFRARHGTRMTYERI
jgi:hypothetical protein